MNFIFALIFAVFSGVIAAHFDEKMSRATLFSVGVFMGFMMNYIYNL